MTLPLEELAFGLYKGAFRDESYLRYNWTLSHLPSTCACGAFPSICHNEIRDVTAALLTEVCSNVCVDPEL